MKILILKKKKLFFEDWDFFSKLGKKSPKFHWEWGRILAPENTKNPWLADEKQTTFSKFLFCFFQLQLWDTAGQERFRYNYCQLGNFECFFVVCCNFLFKLNFGKNLGGNSFRNTWCQAFWIQIRPNVFSGLILQRLSHTALVGKELRSRPSINHLISKNFAEHDESLHSVEPV